MFVMGDIVASVQFLARLKCMKWYKNVYNSRKFWGGYSLLQTMVYLHVTDEVSGYLIVGGDQLVYISAWDSFQCYSWCGTLASELKAAVWPWNWWVMNTTSSTFAVSFISTPGMHYNWYWKKMFFSKVFCTIITSICWSFIITKKWFLVSTDRLSGSKLKIQRKCQNIDWLIVFGW